MKKLKSYILLAINNKDVLCIAAVTIIFLPLLFWNLNSTSLVDFDEAWYGSIATNIIKNKDPFNLEFNGARYDDHPPVGFILMAISTLVFGVGEFAIRLPSALLALFSLYFLYFLGKNLFFRLIGLCASLILGSSVWFVLRARTGNLDTILVCFYILAILISTTLGSKTRNYIYLSVSLALLFLTKSFIGLTALFPITAIIIINRKRIEFNKLLLSVFFLILFIFPWFISSYIETGKSPIEKVLFVGTRSNYVQEINIRNIFDSLTFVYLHFGIREWYYPAIIALFCTIPLVLRYRNLIPVLLWAMVLLFGFLRNAKTEIWHLLPIYPAISLLTSFTLSFFTVTFLGLLPKGIIPTKRTYGLARIVVIGFVLALCLKQIYEFKNEINFFGKTRSGLGEVAKAARGLDGNLYLESSLSVPATVAYYSQKQVSVVNFLPYPQNSLSGFIKNRPNRSILIVEKWKLDADNIPKESYEVISQNQEYVLIKLI